MFKKLMVISMLAVFLSATGYAAAEDVYITPNGSKYHKQDCRLIRNKEKMAQIEKKEAIEKGYTPCKRCFREDAVSDEGEKEQIKEKKSK
jgi:hypothetical protein